ncbi:MAG TPA: isoprenoid biosynthesis glyoxalase ElbB [Geobacterales bacterium]|nr:isoprenoid biosynthesis glyoxalase ElbB [Geobacterales bacterium]
MNKQIGVILSGCGVKDGSEIHEAVLTLLAIDRHGGEAICMAPDMELAEINHLTGKETGVRRNVLQEAARIARGKIRDLKSVSASELDAVVMPGGSGAAKNLCTFASQGANCTIQPDVARLLKEMAAAKKPIVAICIAPTLIAALFGPSLHPTVTIGNDAATAKEITATGSRHQICPVTDFVVDHEHRLITIPAYMYNARISEVATGIERGIAALFAMF